MESLALMPKYEAYKDSGVEWLGDIPSSWELKPGFVAFRESKSNNKGMKENTVLSLSYGHIVVKPEEKLVGLVPESFETYQLVEPDDIIVRCTDLQNDKVSLRTGLAKNKGIITSAYLNLRVKNGFDARFLHYYLHALDTIKVLYKFGSGLRQNLSFLDFKRLPIFEIPEDTQKLIANYLEKKTAQVDDAIAIKEQQISLLKERKQIIIQQAVTQGLDPNVPMKDSSVDWIGKIPEHWEIKPLKHILKLQNVKIEAGKSNLEYLGMECVNSFDGTKNEIKSEADGLSTFFQVGNILFGKLRPYLAKVYVADFEGVCSTEFLVYEVKEGSNTFFSKLMLSNGFISVVDASTYGSKMPRASSDFIGNLKIVNPPFEEQIKIASFVDKQNELFDMNIALQKAQIEKLKEYKTTLINSAVTGKIKITPEMVEQ